MSLLLAFVAGVSVGVVIAVIAGVIAIYRTFTKAL